MRQSALFVKNNLTSIAWSLGAIVVAVSIVGWGSLLGWNLDTILTAYGIFPLLGLIAFTLMWSHYVLYALRLSVNGDKQSTRSYGQITSYIVLVCILLHPGILIAKLFLDGNGLPPGSYAAYVGESNVFFVYLGVVSLLAFLAFELHRWFSNKDWWKYISGASAVAMVLILVHAFNIGGTVSQTWFMPVWWFFALSLIAAYAVLLRKRSLF